MKGMVPRDKMSRKARKALDHVRRNVWPVNPATRIRESGKVYDRNKLRIQPDD